MSQAASTDAAVAQPQPSDWNVAAGDDSATTTQTQFISFAIGDDLYGVDIMAVREIRGWADITHLPKQPEYVRGVMNLRGTIVPILDLRRRFSMDQIDYGPTTVVIVLSLVLAAFLGGLDYFFSYLLRVFVIKY